MLFWVILVAYSDVLVVEQVAELLVYALQIIRRICIIM